MGELGYIEEDFAVVRGTGQHAGERLVLAFGDAVEVLGVVEGNVAVRVQGRTTEPFEGYLKGRRMPATENRVLQFSMVDVQQGDGLVVETPAGKRILIDGGDNKLFARYLANRFRDSSPQAPAHIDAIIVTHGDADHFEGLNQIRDTETAPNIEARKRLFLSVERVFHNGLLKGPGALGDEHMLGRTVATREGRAIVELYNDWLGIDAARLNNPFKRWHKTLQHWAARHPIDMRRLAYGDKAEFGFLRAEGIEVEVLGPIPMSATDAGRRCPGLPLLREPEKTVELALDPVQREQRSFSASHTINGHSIALRLTYGNVRFLLTGDLNQEAMKRLRTKTTDLEAEVLKAPHHGSSDFDLAALRLVRPVVSLLSSGDESSRKEYIHPRATMMGALGLCGRGDVPLIFSTELAAFFEVRGVARTLESQRVFFGFERTNFGIIQIRTDGQRVLVFTHSGREEMKEAYAFTVDADHNITFAKDVKKRR